MATNRLASVLRHICERGTECATDMPSDGQLLERFVKRRDEEAFGNLVARHGPMVLDVCRRILFDQDAAEDAFQATFLVLLRKAGSIRRSELLGNWLYGVAYRTASHARVDAARRRARESKPMTTAPQAEPLAEMSVKEFMAALDDELSRMSSRSRGPLVLCYLEGRTRDEAVKELGCSLATLDRRLKAGRELLRSRLTARGLTMSGVLMGAVLCERAGATSVPASLMDSTLKLATGADVRAEVVVLSKGVLAAMSLSKIKTMMVMLFMIAAVGICGFGFRTQGADRPTVSNREPEPAPKEKPTPVAKKVDPAGLTLTLSADKTETLLQPESDNGADPVKLKLTFTNVSDKEIKLDAYALPFRIRFRCTGPDADSLKTTTELVDRGALPAPAPEDYPVLKPGKSWSPKRTFSFPGDIPEGYGTVIDYKVLKTGTYKLRITAYKQAVDADTQKKVVWLESNVLEFKVRQKGPLADMEDLQGTWFATSFEADGKLDPETVKKGLRLNIEGKRFTLREELGLHFPHGTFALDATKNPKTIDFTRKYGLPKEDPVLIHGIYELDGETLKICQALPGGERPTEFTAKAKSGRQLMVFRREKAQKDKPALEDLPYPRPGTYRVDPYIRAAAALQEMDKDKAVDVLLKFARRTDERHRATILCRMLFAPKPNGQFRRAAIGASRFLQGAQFPDATEYARWPLEPIELVDGVPFLITSGYTLAGQAETAEAYLKYCLSNCDWNSFRFKPKDDEEKQKALKKLLASPKWKTPLGDADEKLLALQLEPEDWSASVNGLRGCLRIAWATRGDTIRPEPTVEFQNILPAKVLAVSNRFFLEARIQDASGKEIKSEGVDTWATRLVPEQWKEVKAGASLAYPADLRSTGADAGVQWFPRGQAVVLVLSGTQWKLQPGRYSISARLIAKPPVVSVPNGATLPLPAAPRWEGMLTLPAVTLEVPSDAK